MFFEGFFGNSFGQGEGDSGYAAKTELGYIICLAKDEKTGVIGDLSSIETFPELFGRYLYVCQNQGLDVKGIAWDFTPKTRTPAGLIIPDEPIDYIEQFSLAQKVREVLSEPQPIPTSDFYFSDLSGAENYQ